MTKEGAQPNFRESAINLWQNLANQGSPRADQVLEIINRRNLRNEWLPCPICGTTNGIHGLGCAVGK